MIKRHPFLLSSIVYIYLLQHVGTSQNLFEMAERNTKTKTSAIQKAKNAADQAMEKLSDQLSCSVCLEEYRRPRVLPCLHVFCEACLEKLAVAQGGRLSAPCPNCRQPAQLPQGGVASLPSAFYIQHLFEVKDALEKVRDPKKAQCDKCGEGEAQGFCRDCGQFICQLCLDMHRKWREFQSHEISSFNEVQETASKMVTPKKVTTLCPKHPTEQIKIYCEKCDELICRDCTVKTHRDHSYDLIPDAFPKHRDTIIASLEPVKTQLACVVETIKNLEARSERVERRGKKAKDKVDAEIERLHAILEARRRELHSEVDGKVRQASKELAAQRDQYELRQAQLSSCVEFVEGSLQSGTQEEVLSMKRQVVQRAQQMAEPQQLQLGPEQVLRVVCADLSSACQTLGEVHFQLGTCEGTHVKTISNIERPRHIAFGSTGVMVVCDAKCMTVFDSSYKRLRSFGNTGPEESRIGQPLGVTISSDNIVFIASVHCVTKFTLEGQFIASVGSLGSGRLQFSTPYAITYNDTNNKVYVCDTHNHRITILNLDLTFHGSFGSKGRETGQFYKPFGISVDSRGNVLVADYYNKRIQVFDASGRYLSSITDTTPEQKLRGPMSVSVGPDDCVYVGENRVSIFDQTGKYIKSFGKKGDKDGEFKDPNAIAVSDEGYVYVSDTKNNRIQVFK